jgi:hypothetical protein
MSSTNRRHRLPLRQRRPPPNLAGGHSDPGDRPSFLPTPFPSLPLCLLLLEMAPALRAGGGSWICSELILISAADEEGIDMGM